MAMHTAGIPGGFQTALVLIDYHATHSLYDLINLVKLTGNFGQRYCCSALMVLLGREPQKELADLEALLEPSLLTTAYQQGLPKIENLKRAHLTKQQDLDLISTWFGYTHFVDPLSVIDNPRMYIDWMSDTLGYQYQLKGLYPFHHYGCRAFIESILLSMGQDKIPKTLGATMLRLFTSTEGK
jgi:hypothetical protein